MMQKNKTKNKQKSVFVQKSDLSTLLEFLMQLIEALIIDEFPLDHHH